jgi:hypothetical protein
MGTVLTRPVEFFFWIGRKVLQRVGNTGKKLVFPAQGILPVWIPCLHTQLNFSSGLAEKLRKELATLAKVGISLPRGFFQSGYRAYTPS